MAIDYAVRLCMCPRFQRDALQLGPRSSNLGELLYTQSYCLVPAQGVREFMLSDISVATLCLFCMLVQKLISVLREHVHTYYTCIYSTSDSTMRCLVRYTEKV